MNPSIIRSLHAWFGRYVRQFHFADRQEQHPIFLKVVHCQRVRREMLHLASVLGLDEQAVALAGITGLLHDIGRFEQYNQYRTFVDPDSVNHAKLGVQVLQKHAVLHALSPEDEERILKAISYHNQLGLPRGEKEDVLFLTKMIRDADKLDIWRVFIEHNRLKNETKNSTVDLDLPATSGVSESALADLMACKNVDYRHVTNCNDFALMRLG